MPLSVAAARHSWWPPRYPCPWVPSPSVCTSSPSSGFSLFLYLCYPVTHMRFAGSVLFAVMSTIKVFLIKVITHDCSFNYLIVTLEVSAVFMLMALFFFL